MLMTYLVIIPTLIVWSCFVVLFLSNEQNRFAALYSPYASGAYLTTYNTTGQRISGTSYCGGLWSCTQQMCNLSTDMGVSWLGVELVQPYTDNTTCTIGQSPVTALHFLETVGTATGVITASRVFLLISFGAEVAVIMACFAIKVYPAYPKLTMIIPSLFAVVCHALAIILWIIFYHLRLVEANDSPPSYIVSSEIWTCCATIVMTILIHLWAAINVVTLSPPVVNQQREGYVVLN